MMKSFLFALILLIFSLAGCFATEATDFNQSGVNQTNEKVQPATETNSPEENNPLKVSICDIKQNPADYNQKSVEITGFMSYGFEDSAVYDPLCADEQHIWMEYGGTAATGTMYCCGVSAERSRPKPLVIENITTSLVEDDNFRRFDALLKRPPDATIHATVQGRFFSGEKMEGGTLYGGYGHMGMSSLFVIEKVVAVDSQERNDLDYRSSDYNQPELRKADSYEYLTDYSPKDTINLQQKAEAGEREWSFSDPQRVAVEAIARFAEKDEKSISGIKRIRQAQGSFDYKWKDKTNDITYIVAVNRPYWLSFYASDPKKVAWTVFSAYKIP